MSNELGDLNSAARIREVIKQTVYEVLATARPKPRYAVTQAAPDFANKTVDIRLPGETSDFEIPLSGPIYPESGATISVVGPQGTPVLERVLSGGAYFRLADGTVANPGLFFDDDPNTGIYRVGADVIGITTNGVQRLRIDTVSANWGGNSTGDALIMFTPSASAPAYSFAGDTTTGMYRDGSNSIGWATNGIERMQVGTSNLNFAAAVTGAASIKADGAGTQADPAYQFVGDPDSGLFRVGANDICLGVGNLRGITVNGNTTSKPFAYFGSFTTGHPLIAGHSPTAAATPNYTFVNDPDTGMYRVTTNQVGWAAGGVLVVRAVYGGSSTSYLLVGGATDGNAVIHTNPAVQRATYGFYGDLNTGMYRPVNHAIGWKVNSTQAMVLTTSHLYFGNGGTTRALIKHSTTGTLAAPTYSFYGDQSTGMYRANIGDLEFPGSGARAMYVGSLSSTNPGFWAPGVYNQTNANAANVVVVDANSKLLRSTSSMRFKKDVEDLDEQIADDMIKNARPVWFRGTAGYDDPAHSFYGLIAEQIAEVDPRLVAWEPAEHCDCQPPADLVARHKDEDDHYDFSLQPQHWHTCHIPGGVQYDRIVPHLLSVVKRVLERVETLERAAL